MCNPRHKTPLILDPGPLILERDPQATFSPRQERQALLGRWGFTCTCEVCGAGEEERARNDRVRQEIALQHSRVPELLGSWDTSAALQAARRKVELMRGLQVEMITTLPSALLECFEMSRLGAAGRQRTALDNDEKEWLREAKELSDLLGDRFVHVYHEKLKQVEEECRQIKRK